MIYSIVGMDDIFYKESAVQTEFQRIDGGLLEICTVNGQKRVNRLFSTDPHLYLDSRYYPYSILNGGK